MPPDLLNLLGVQLAQNPLNLLSPGTQPPPQLSLPQGDPNFRRLGNIATAPQIATEQGEQGPGRLQQVAEFLQQFQQLQQTAQQGITPETIAKVLQQVQARREKPQPVRPSVSLDFSTGLGQLPQLQPFFRR